MANDPSRVPQWVRSGRPAEVRAETGEAWVPSASSGEQAGNRAGLSAGTHLGLSTSRMPERGPIAAGVAKLRAVGAALELMVGVIILMISPVAFVALVVMQAKWALTLGLLSTAAHAFWRARFDGWAERAAVDGMRWQGHAKLLLLTLFLNCMFWGMLLAQMVPAAWVAEFNAGAPGWLADRNWERWSEPFSRAIDLFVATSFVELLAYLLALAPFFAPPVLLCVFVARYWLRRPDLDLLFLLRALFVGLLVCYGGYLVFQDELWRLFWGINGYLLWKGSDVFALLTILFVGFIPFRIAALLRGGHWLRRLFA